MKKRYYPFLLLAGLLCLGAIYFWNTPTASSSFSEPPLEDGPTANDWLFRQRAYPSGEIDMAAFKDAVKFRANKRSAQQNKPAKNLFTATWTLGGPLNTGGRVTDVEMIPGDPGTIYLGAASGGIFRSTDLGASWEPIFDEMPTLSIGDIALAPSDNQTIYVGTGEANAGGGSLAYDGLGVYRSTDGGDSWESRGLEEVGSIGRVLVDPNDPERVYVAAMGTLFANNTERGVYRSLDGGENWEQVLFRSDSTGAIDLAMHPSAPQTIYAALWERVRRPTYRSYNGPTSGIYKTTDGGDSWTELTVGLPNLPFNKGRIGLAVAPSDPNIVYAAYANEIGFLEDVYRSENGGASWSPIGLEGLNSVPYEWWFNRLVVHPTNPDRLYYIGFFLNEYMPNTGTWEIRFPGTHVDQHSLWINPNDPNYMLLGNDGGLYWSEDGGLSFEQWLNLPITQFYTCEVDNSQPQRLYGGTQDNGTNRTLTGNLDDWARIFGGDGFRVRVDPTDNSRVYAESQYGNFGRSETGGFSFESATEGFLTGDRFNWNTPFVLSPQTPTTLYLGSNRVYKSDDAALFWEAISPDLTDGPGGGNLTYGTITSLSVSPLDAQTIWVGTDEGKLWVTTNEGTNWTLVSAGLPNRWVTSVKADPNDANGAIVTFSGYRYGTDMSHVYLTTDLGDTWTDVGGDLPDIPVNDVIIHPTQDQWYLATDIGVFFTDNQGINWHILGENLPSVVVTDLSLHVPTNKLVAATYGRSLWTVQVDVEVASEEIVAPALDWSIGPNPFRDQLRIDLTVTQTGTCQLNLFQLDGKKVATKMIHALAGEQRTVEWATLNTLPAGGYFLQWQMNGMQTGKILIKQ